MLSPASAPGFLIRRLQQISVQLFLKRTNTGISSVQYGALQVIESTPDIDQITLSLKIDTDRTTIVRVVDKLFKAGLILRDRRSSDRRSNSLHITDKGVMLLREMNELADRSQQELLAPLTAEEQASFMRLLRKIVFAHALKTNNEDENSGEDGERASLEWVA